MPEIPKTPPYVDERGIIDLIADITTDNVELKFQRRFEAHEEHLRDLDTRVEERTEELARTMHRLALLLSASRPSRWTRFKGWFREYVYDGQPVRFAHPPTALQFEEKPPWL